MIKKLEFFLTTLFVFFMLVACSYQNQPNATTNYHIWRYNDSIKKISALYNVPENKVRQMNQIYDEADLNPGKKIYLPDFATKDTQLASKLSVNTLNQPRQISFFNFTPVSGRMTSKFGYRNGRIHQGIDIAAVYGTPIAAVADGVVEKSGWIKGYGSTVIISHNDNVSTLYAHNSKNLVVKNQFVKAGQIIALIGQTGNATGSVLHFEVLIKGQPVDPIAYLPDLTDDRLLALE